MRSYNFVSALLLSAFAIVTINAAIPAVVNAQSTVTDLDSETEYNDNQQYSDRDQEQNFVPEETDEILSENYQYTSPAPIATTTKQVDYYGYDYSINSNDVTKYHNHKNYSFFGRNINQHFGR